MVLTIIFWVLAGSGLLWVVLLNVIGIAWTFSFVKRLIFGKNTTTKISNLDKQ